MRSIFLLASVASVSGASGIAGADPLDNAFGATPDQLLAAARPFTSADAEAIVLRDETTITYDEAGRSRRRNRVVFVIDKQAAVDGWGSLSLGWSPFFQDKPIVRARVIDTAGHATELDPSLITDAPVSSDSQGVFSDRRKLEVPLPRLAVGAVVEEEYTTADREPLLAAGVAQFRPFGRAIPVQRTVVQIDAPVTRKLQVVARGFAKAPVPRKVTRAGRTSWTYDVGPLDVLPEGEPGLPGEARTNGYIGITTGTSWTAVADEYRRIVDKRLGDGPVALPDGLKGGSERETIDRAVRWVHQHVRYTGIEFSDAEIVPWPPAQVVARGFGDCKDKATLLVHLLRALGIRAEVVLLLVGPGEDVERDLPGMGEFDHAIVRARTAQGDIWIDATEETLPAGQLPARDQGRHALVIAPDTRDLVDTPRGAAADNLIREVRTYEIAEQDTGTVTEVSEQHGVFWGDMRTWIRDTSHDEAMKSLTRYVDGIYKGKLASFTSSDPTDISKPFTLTLQVTGTQRAFTYRSQADVYLFPSDTFADLPQLFTSTSEATDRELAKRRFDYEWFRPHVYEIEHRLVVPPGYTLPQVTAREQQALGTMWLTITRRIENDQLVIAFRLDTGKPRITRDELIATRAAIQQLRKQPAEHVVIARTAELLVKQGKLEAAAAECQRLIALHPKHAVHYDQLADIYRQAGLGNAARRAARKGVEVEPVSDAYDMLAWQLRHDTFGRDFGLDADLKGALVAYRKALELDPKHLGALTDLATVLVHGDRERGILGVDPRDRREAIGLLKRANAIAKTQERDVEIARQLILLGDFKEAEAAARAMEDSEQRSQFLLAAVAGSRGSKEALALASSLPKSQDRTRVLQGAAGFMLILRRYDPARDFFTEARGALSDPMQDALMAHLGIVDRSKLDPGDPKTPAIELIRAIVDLPDVKPAWDATMATELARQERAVRKLPQLRIFRVMPPPVADDLLISFAHFKVDGSAATGWSVLVELGPQKFTCYVVRDHGRAILIGLTDGADGVGALMLRQLSTGHAADAARWLSWMLPDQRTRLFTLLKNAIAQTPDGKPTQDIVELAAAVLGVDREPKLALPILRRCAVPGDEMKRVCHHFTSVALGQLHDYKAVDELEQTPAPGDSPTAAIARRAFALHKLGRLDEGVALLDAALVKNPDDLDLLRERVWLALARGKPDDVRAALDRLAAAPGVTLEDLNNVAWERLFVDSIDKARAVAQQAQQMQADLPQNVENTLAAVEAEQDHPFAAWTFESKSLEGQPDQKPEDADWFVIGRIAETFGLRDDAIDAYHRIGKPKPDQIGISGYELARRRLDHLGAR